MASSEPPRAIDRVTLVRTISRLNPSDLAVVVMFIEGAAQHISRHGTVPEQAAELFHWVESPTGPGLEAIQQALEQLSLVPSVRRLNSQVIPQHPGPQPSFTGVVEVPLDGRVWRVRFSVGKPIDAKPFCPRHGVPLKPRSASSNNWHCTNHSCDYYQYIPSLAVLSTDRTELLTRVYSQIERSVREGVGYRVCPDDPSSQI